MAVTTFGVHAFVYVPVPAQGKGFSPDKTRRGKGSDVAGKDGEHSLVVAELKIFHVHWNELGPGRRSAAGKGKPGNRPVPKDILCPLENVLYVGFQTVVIMEGDPLAKGFNITDLSHFVFFPENSSGSTGGEVTKGRFLEGERVLRGKVKLCQKSSVI
jgi:hypothetical protein